MPRTTKGITPARIADTHTDTAVCRYSLEYNFERRKCQRVIPQMVRLNDIDKKSSEAEKSDIMFELGPELLADQAST